MKKLNVIDWIALVLVVVGAINWGLVGLFSFDLVSYVFLVLLKLTTFVPSQVVYTLVGVAGVYLFVSMLMKRGDE